MKALRLVGGAVLVLLGGLWLIQGLGLVTIKPILCVANCEVLEGPAPTWAVIGLIALIAGALLVRSGLRRPSR